MADDYPVGTAGVVTVGGSASSGVIDFGNDYDVFTVFLTEGVTYTFNLTSSIFDTNLVLYANFNFVSSTDDFGSGTNSQITYTAASSGIYYLEAFGSDWTEIGSYQISSAEIPDDYPVGTAGVVTVGGSASSGVIDFDNDYDFFSVFLTAGVTYTFNLSSSSFDTDLLLYAPGGNWLLARNDDFGSGTNSQITYTATSSGTYYLTASGFDSTDLGSYQISAEIIGTAQGVAIDGSPTDGANPLIDSLVWGRAWQDTPGLPSSGGPVTITYAPADAQELWDEYTFQYAPSMVWSEAGLGAVPLALGSWASIANVEFVETTDIDNADVCLIQATEGQLDGSLGRSDIPDPGAAEPLYVRINGEDPSWSATGLAQGGYGYITLVHELGHMLGLAHPHDGGDDGEAFPGVEGPFGDFGTNNLNQGIFTTMSYNSGWGSQFPSHTVDEYEYGWEATPMALDIAAIQVIYGANMTHALGNDTYHLPTSNTAGTYWLCIWDAGGTDTISNAGASSACIINLNAAPLVGANAGGYVSWNSGIVGGVTIANGVILENAIGGSGNDTLTGNSAANSLDGGAGSDTLIGGLGNDIYVVSIATDNITETAGQGTADRAHASVSFTLATGDNIEFLETINAAATTAINLTGNEIAQTITGNAGANRLYGLAGNDTLNGGAGIDTLTGGAGRDQMTGGSQRDIFDFNAISETGNTASTRELHRGFRKIGGRHRCQHNRREHSFGWQQRLRLEGYRRIHGIIGR